MKHALAASLLLGLSFVVSGAHAGTPYLMDTDVAAMQGKRLAITQRETPGFMLATPGSSTSSMFVGGFLLANAVMKEQGKDFVAANKLEDPTPTVRMALADAMGAMFAMQSLAPDTTPTDAKKPKAIAALHADADYILDVRPQRWGVGYLPTHWGHYAVGYAAELQLIDAHTGRLMATAMCAENTSQAPEPPTLDTLRANDGKLVKQALQHLAWKCAGTLATIGLSLPTERVPQVPAALSDPYATTAIAEPGPASRDN